MLPDVLKIVFHSYFSSQNKLIKVKPKSLSKHISIRNNRIDVRTLKDTFLFAYHLPPKQLSFKRDMVIIDIGANTGLTSCHLSELYPSSQILGFELDKKNSEIAIKNTTQYPNIKIINQGVWEKDFTMGYSLDNENDAYRVIPLDTKNSDIRTVKLLSMTNALSGFDSIDFLKMDIEGAEVEIFESNDLDWLDKVKSINIEFHLEYTEELDRFKLLFKNKGYIIQEENQHWCSIIGYRK